MPLQPASDWFAQQMTGDLGGITYVQRSGNRRTSYAKTYPQRKPSGTQLIFRARFAEAIASWRALPPDKKRTLDQICLRFGMIMSGYNVYISCSMVGHMDAIADWAQQIGEPW